MKKIIIFIITVFLFALMAWIGGYNFDKRNAGVGAYFACSICLSLIAAAIIDEDD